jgi:hypothetical protein
MQNSKWDVAAVIAAIEQWAGVGVGHHFEF